MTRNSAHDGRPNAGLSNERGGVNSRTAIASLGIAGGAGLIAGTLYLSAAANQWQGTCTQVRISCILKQSGDAFVCL